jgi:hypothetical protein
MLILDKPRPFAGEQLIVPLYHRGHLSLLVGTKIWLCLLPGSDPNKTPEIIVSPINYEAWADLWRISVTTHELSGVVNKILRALQNLNINVMAEESSSIERQRFHTIELVIDASKYIGIQDDASDKRRIGLINSLPDLERSLLAAVLPYVALSSSGEPRLSIRRVEGLFDAAQSYSKASSEFAVNHRFRPVVAYTEVENRQGVLTLPVEIRASLRLALSEKNTDPRGSRYLLVSDTRDRYLRVYFFKQSDLITSVTIEHDEKIGALAEITSRLHHSGFNILTSLSRLHVHGGRAQYELVLQASEEMTSEADMRDRLKVALSDRALVEEFKPSLGYKLNYRAPGDFDNLKSSGATQEVLESHNEDARNFTIEQLGRQYAIFLNKTTKEDRLRFSLAQRLLDEERRIQGKFAVRRVLFISYGFNDSDRFEKIEREAHSMGFEVRVGRHLGTARVHRDGIITIIDECTHFLGIWTAEGAKYKGSGKSWPSPWLLWELGVAEARGKRPRLLISTQIQEDAWKRVYPELPHTLFGPDEFFDRLRESLDILTAEPASIDEQRQLF